jgi:site-specific DNA recombinase
MESKCECRNIPAKKFDDKIWDLLVNIVKEQDLLDNFLKTTDQIDYSNTIQELTARYRKLKKQRETITRWYRENVIESEMAERDLKAINRDLTQITAALNESLLAQKKRTGSIRLDVEEILNAKTFEEKRRVLLNSGLNVYAVRKAEDTFFYFSY